MITLFNIYVVGAFLTGVIYLYMIEFDSSREYLAELAEILTDHSQNQVISKIHPYVILSLAFVLFTLLSWVGFVILVKILFDFYNWLKNY